MLREARRDPRAARLIRLRHFVFHQRAPDRILHAINAVTLPPDLERFAAQAIAAGRYRDMSEVVQAAMTLLQEAEAELAAFAASLDAAKAEGARDGYFTIEEVMREADAIIEEIAKERA